MPSTHTSTVLTEFDLAQFTGECFYRHTLVPSVIYTQGVKFLADRAGAYWLIDEIAYAQLDPSVKAEDFQSWTLKLGTEGKGAQLTCTDGDKGDGPVTLFSVHIGYTDFPLQEINLFCEFDGVRRTILLPSEH
jgi:hypothetical protein